MLGKSFNAISDTTGFFYTLLSLEATNILSIRRAYLLFRSGTVIKYPQEIGVSQKSFHNAVRCCDSDGNHISWPKWK